MLVDPWAIANASSPAAHLNATPANGTLVEGLPSATYWTFSAGDRTLASPAPSATAVNDTSLSGLPIG